MGVWVTSVVWWANTCEGPWGVMAHGAGRTNRVFVVTFVDIAAHAVGITRVSLWAIIVVVDAFHFGVAMRILGALAVVRSIIIDTVGVDSAAAMVIVASYTFVLVIA